MVEIRPIQESDYEQWLVVYQHYSAHYQYPLADDRLATTWSWLMDDDHVTCGLVAVVNGDILGAAHYRAMPSPLRGQYVGFLDDLIVSPESRGQGIAQALLAELKSIGQQNKWATIRWITRDDNYRARAVYDRLSEKTNWVTYEMKF